MKMTTIKTCCALAALVLLSGTAQSAVQPVPADGRCTWPGGPVLDGATTDSFFGGAIVAWFAPVNNIASLANVLTDYNKKQCVFLDGKPFQGILLGAYTRAFKDLKDWDRALARVNELKTAYPDAIYLPSLETEYWIAAAWFVRGGGYASSVTPDGMKLFTQRMERAEKLLKDTAPRAMELPQWYEQMIKVQSALGRSETERDKVFVDGATRYKTYWPLYFTMQTYLLPRWGGSWSTIDNFVDWSVKNTENTEGKALYARLYWSVAGSMLDGEQLFKTTKAQWPKMKAGFQDLMAKNPDSRWNLNNFAEFACEAGDSATYRALRKQIGKDILPNAWRRGYVMEVCDAKFKATK